MHVIWNYITNHSSLEYIFFLIFFVRTFIACFFVFFCFGFFLEVMTRL